MKTVAKAGEKKPNNRTVNHKKEKQNITRKGPFPGNNGNANIRGAGGKFKQVKFPGNQKGVTKEKLEKQRKQWKTGSENPRHQKHNRKHITQPEKHNQASNRVVAQVRAMKQVADKECQQRFQEHINEKQRKHKMMTAKTRKGQPVMQGRMELMYEKIKKMVGQNPDK